MATSGLRAGLRLIIYETHIIQPDGENIHENAFKTLLSSRLSDAPLYSLYGILSSLKTRAIRHCTHSIVLRRE